MLSISMYSYYIRNIRLKRLGNVHNLMFIGRWENLNEWGWLMYADNTIRLHLSYFYLNSSSTAFEVSSSSMASS